MVGGNWYARVFISVRINPPSALSDSFLHCVNCVAFKLHQWGLLKSSMHSGRQKDLVCLFGFPSNPMCSTTVFSPTALNDNSLLTPTAQFSCTELAWPSCMPLRKGKRQTSFS